jgi:hypothetical protein
VDEVAGRLAAIALTGLLLGGCGEQSPVLPTGPETSPSAYRIYQTNQPWDEPSGWRLAITGVRCGAATRLAAGDTDADHVCVAGVTFTNQGSVARPFTGTAEEPGPTWRVSGYDAQGHEFHGHARQVDPTAPGATGSTDLIFEVPDGTELRRILIAQGMVDLPRLAGAVR